MIHSSRRDRKTKAIAEALAMIANAQPELEPQRPRPVHEIDEWLRAMGEAADAVQDHAATPSDLERFDNEARGGVGIDLPARAEPDVDGRVAAVKEDLELTRQRSFVERGDDPTAAGD